MRKLLVEVTCDKCDNVTEELEAVNLELVLSNAPNQTLEIDLCSSCVDDFIHGARIKPKRKRIPKQGGFKLETAAPASPPADDAVANQCPVCGNSYKTDRGLRAHQTMKEH